MSFLSCTSRVIGSPRRREESALPEPDLRTQHWRPEIEVPFRGPETEVPWWARSMGYRKGQKNYEVLRVLWWFMNAYDGLSCFMRVYDGLSCFHDGAWCFMMAHHAFMMVLDVLWWLIMLYDGVWCFMLVYDGVWCFMLVYDGVWWCMMIFHGLSWCAMMYDGLWWFMMVYHGYLWFMVYHLISWNSWLISFIMEFMAYQFVIVYHGLCSLWCFILLRLYDGVSWFILGNGRLVIFALGLGK